MKKFLLGLLSGFVLAGLALVIVAFALMRAGDRRSAVPDGSLLVMRLEGEIPEQAPVTIPLPMFESQSPATVADLWSMLRQAEKDGHIARRLRHILIMCDRHKATMDCPEN